MVRVDGVRVTDGRDSSREGVMLKNLNMLIRSDVLKPLLDWLQTFPSLLTGRSVFFRLLSTTHTRHQQLDCSLCLSALLILFFFFFLFIRLFIQLFILLFMSFSSAPSLFLPIFQRQLSRPSSSSSSSRCCLNLIQFNRV